MMKTVLLGVALGAVAILSGCSSEGVMADTHDVVQVSFRRGGAAADSPFGGTVAIELTAEYDACFKTFYDTNPNYVVDGVDGAPVFGGEDQEGEGWQDRLCDDSDPSLIQCTVTEYRQVLEVGIPPTLTVRYSVMGNVEDRQLNFGPLPNSDLAGCEGGVSPRVRLTGARGLGQGDTQIWRMENGGEEAAPGQGAPMTVNAGAA